MEIKLADFSHKLELLEIWREAFGDDEDYILSFLNAYLLPEYNAPVIIADGKIVSVLYLVEFELYADMKVIGNCAYLFAAATREAYRGRGYMGELIKYAIQLYKNRGISAIFLFPQEGDEKLFKYYEKFGFKSIYQTKKIQGCSCRPLSQKPLKGCKPSADGGESCTLTDFRLVNHELNNVEIFDGLYQSYVEFTAKQNLSPLKDRLFYFKCASSYLDTPEKHFGVFERELYNSTENNVEKFCYVFYKKFENNYYIDDIIMAEYNEMRGNKLNFNETAELLADFILNSGEDIRLEMNILPEGFENNKLAMILGLNEKVNNIIENLKSPVYLNMFMNI